MKIQLECIPCLFNQLIRAGKFIYGNDIDKIKELIYGFGYHLKDIDFNLTPPHAGQILYDYIIEKSGIEDPYKKIKKESINLVKSKKSLMQKIIDNSSDKLLTAIELSILGNIIDFGASESFDFEKELENLNTEDFNLKDYKIFKEKLNTSNTILFIGDNAGETVFDTFLLKELKDRRKNLIYTVRESPIINDSTYEDAIMSGIDKYAEIVKPGHTLSGLDINLTSSKFRDLFYSSDMIISKGQGNFETLSDCKRDIFFLFRVKCKVVSELLNEPIGEAILHYHFPNS